MFELIGLSIIAVLCLFAWAMPFLPFLRESLSQPNIYYSLTLFFAGLMGWGFVSMILKDQTGGLHSALILILSAASPIYTYIKPNKNRPNP